MLDKDILLLLPQFLDLENVLKLEQVKKIVNNDYFVWKPLIYRMFGDCKKIYEEMEGKQRFIKLYKLNKMKELFKIKCSLSKFYFKTVLDLSNFQLKELPKEICQLTSLQELHLSYNQLKEIPKEICQ